MKLNYIGKAAQGTGAANKLSLRYVGRDERDTNKGGLLGGIGYLGEKVGAGFMQSVEGIWDYAAGGIADLFGADEWAKAQFDNDWFGNWYNTAGDWYNPSDAMKVAGDVAGGIGTSLPAVVGAIGATVLSGGALAPAAVTAIGSTIAGLGAAGTATKEAYRETGELTGKEYGYGALVGATEAAIEGVTGVLGAGSGRALKAIGSIGKKAAREGAEAAAKTAAKKGIGKVLGNSVKHIGSDFLSEATEEGIAEFVTPYYARMTYDSSAENATLEEIAYASFVGGLSGVIMGGGTTVASKTTAAISDTRAGETAVTKGYTNEIKETAKRIAEEEARSPSGYTLFEEIKSTYEALEEKTGGGEITTAGQKRLLGRLQKMTSAAHALPAVEASAVTIMQNPEAAAERFSAMGITDESGKPIEITAEKLREGIDFEGLTPKTDESVTKKEAKRAAKEQRYALRRAISQNPLLLTLSVADATGKLMLNAENYAEGVSRGVVGNRGDYQTYLEVATPEQKVAMAARLGIEGDLDAVAFEDVQLRAAEYAASPEGRAYIADTTSARKAAESVPPNKKAIPRVVGATRKDGVYRYGGENGIAIVKEGDAVRIYDYRTRNLSRPLTTTEATAALQKYHKSAEGRRYAISESGVATDAIKGTEATSPSPSVDNYTEEQYNNYGWARANGVLTASENAHYRSQFAAAVAGGDKYRRTKSGEIMIPVSDGSDAAERKIVYAKGTIDDPIITRVLEIDLDNNTVISEKRSEIYALERAGIRQETGGVFTLHTPADGQSFAQYERESDRNVGHHHQFGTDRGAGRGKTQRVVGAHLNEDGSTTYTYADGTTRRMALPEDGEITAERATVPADVKTNIDTWAREHVKGYGELIGNEQREIRALIRQAMALGIPEADIEAYATVSARSSVRITFSKERALAGRDNAGQLVYADGFYDPATNEIVVNPEGKRGPGKLLLHELAHTLYKVKKFGKALDKSVRHMDEERATEVAQRYAAYGAEVASEDVAVHHAEDVLGNRENLSRLLRDEPTIGDKILSFFGLARTEYRGNTRLSRAAGRLYRHFKTAYDAFSDANRGNLAAEGVTLTNPENTQVSEDGKRYAIPVGDEIVDARSVTEQDVRTLLDNAFKKQYRDGSYIPVRVNTPSVLIEAAQSIGKTIDDLPIILNVGKARQMMSSQREWALEQKRGTAHDFTVDDVISLIKAMDDPKQIIYQSADERYVEVVEFETAEKTKAVAVLEIGENKNPEYLNGYNGGFYHVLVTAFEPDTGYVETLLGKDGNIRIYPKKKKGSSQRGSGNKVPSHLNESPFATSIPDSSEKINPSAKNSSRRSALPDSVSGTVTAVGKERARYEPSRKEKLITAKDRLYIETVDEMYGMTKYLRQLGGMTKSEAEARVQMGRAARTQAQAMLGIAQYDVFSDKPERMGKGLLEIYKPTQRWSKEKQDDLELFLFHSLNIDRMTLETRSRAWAAPLRNEVQTLENDLATLKERRRQLRKDLRQQQTAINKAKVRRGTVKTDAAKARWKARIDAFTSDRATLTKDVKQAEQEIAKKKRALKKATEKLEAAILENKPVFGKNEAEGRDHDITAAESRAFIDSLKEKYGDGFAQFESIAKEIYGYLDNLQHLRVEAGLISQSDADYMKKLYPHYVPSYREEKTRGGGSVGKGGKLEVSSTVRRAKGGGGNLLEIRQSIAEQTNELMRFGHTNLLAREIYEAAKASGDTTYVEILSEEEVKRSDEVDRSELLRPKEGILTFLHDGKKITMKLSKELVLAFEGIEGNSFDTTNPLLRAPARVMNGFKKLVTSFNPAFMIRNPIRDAQDAGLNSRHPMLFAKYYTTLAAAREILSNSKDWQLYCAVGGFSSTVFEDTLREAAGYAGFESLVGLFNAKDRKGLQKALAMLPATAKAMFRSIENANAFFEQITRFCEFKASLESGDSVAVALNNSAEVTTNFGRRGRLAKNLNATIMPFLNPAIQGFDKIFRNISDIFSGEKTGKQVAAAIATLISKAMILGVVPMLFNSLMYEDDEDYEKLHENDKENYFLIKYGDGTFIKIPRGRLASVIGGLYNRSAKLARGEDAELSGYVDNVITQITPVENLTGTIFNPISDAKNNRTWYGGEIEGQEWDDTAPSQRKDEGTSSLAVALADAINALGVVEVSPKKVHYVLDQYSGVIGDLVIPATTQKEHKDFVLGNFTLDAVTNNKLSTRFYDLFDETRYANTEGDDTAKYRLKYLNTVKKTVKKINDEIDVIRNDTTIKNAEKLERVRVLRALINVEYSSALTMIEDVDAAIESTASIEAEALAAGNSTATAETLRDTEVTRLVFGAERAIKEYDEKLYAKYFLFNGVGVDYEDLYDFYFSTRGLQSDHDEDGEAVNGSRKKKVLSVINGMKIPTVQKILLLTSRGYALSDGDIRGVSAARGKQMLLSLITRGNDLSGEERIALAKACGFTVKRGKIVRP